MRYLMTLFALTILAFAATAKEDPNTLASEAGCGGCHQVEQTMVGPSWQAIADEYRGEDGASEKLQKRMRSGAEGNWGDTPMAPVTQEQLKDDELASVIDWILQQ